MRLFEIHPDRATWGNYYIEACHRWGLPGVKCPLCGGWGDVATQYPAIDISTFSNAEAYRDFWPVGLDELAKLRSALAPVVPADYPLPPGTAFGPVEGEARGRFDDFCWVMAWTPLIKGGALKKFADAGIPLIAARANLEFKGNDKPELFELHLEPRARLSEGSLPPEQLQCCEMCGRQPIQRPDTIVVDRATAPTDLHLFRGRDLTTAVFGSDRFVQTAKETNATGIVATEVRLE
jgi:uncharacterized double-CXXCG motif protein